MSALAAGLDSALRGGQPWVESPGERLDAAALDAVGAQVARSLQTHGVVQNEPVHLIIGNRSRDVAGLLGIWRAGAVAVPVHVSTPGLVRAAL
ncbi:MAG TPA: AMP-binding protein, partial [Xanthobacteraceae bacterium]|nr:AMP-binding protein [Xanthobacteraceae bacterium]